MGMIVPASVAAYQQQWFTSYTETAQGIWFSCTQQCVIVLWTRDANDHISIKWIQGQWQIVLWALWQDGKLIPLSQQVITPNQSDYLLMISSSQINVPAQAQLWVVFVGNVSASAAQVSLWNMSIWQKIGQIWKWFWTNEWLMPYTINLRYGIKFMSTSIVKVWYIIFILIVCYILFSWAYSKHKAKAIFYYGICMVLLLWIRNLANWVDRTVTGLDQYTFADSDQKVFFDLWDYIVFVDKMRDALALDDQFGGNDCTIMSQGQSRPFVAHLDNVYIKPCNPTTDKSKADYLIYYHQAIPQEDAWKTKLLEFNGSFVLKNN